MFEQSTIYPVSTRCPFGWVARVRLGSSAQMRTNVRQCAMVASASPAETRAMAHSFC